MGRRGLYPTTSSRGSTDGVKTMMNVLAYADGEHDLIYVADRMDAYGLDVLSTIEQLRAAALLEEPR